MTKKELFDGLNYIDDQIIEEAQPTGESAGYSDEIYVKIMKPITAEKKTKQEKHKNLHGQQKRLPQWRQSLLLQS